MNFQSLIGGLFLLVASVAWAQITIDNPRRLDISEERAQLLHKIICRVVAEEFHVRAGRADGPITILLGQTKRMAREIIHRVDQVTLSAKTLREKNGPARVLPDLEQNCPLAVKLSERKGACALEKNLRSNCESHLAVQQTSRSSSERLHCPQPLVGA